MDNKHLKRMHKRLAFEMHQGRALGFYPPGVTPGSEVATGTASVIAASTTTTPAAAATTPATQVTRATTTQGTTAQTTAAQDTKTTKADDVAATTSTTATTQVAAANTSTTVTHAATTVPTTPPAVATTRANTYTVAAVETDTSQAQYTITRTTRASSLFPSSSSALPSSSATADDGPSVGSIAGYAAAAIAGVAVISIFAVWMIRRKRRREEDADIDTAPFNRQSWLRNSTMIPDDTPTPATTNFPPPRRGPEMIDRSFNATPVSTYGGMNQYPQNNFGYATQPSYQPGAVIFSPSSANTSFGPGGSPATPLPFSPVYDPATPNPFEQQAGYTEVTRGEPTSPFTPYQQQQFDDIQRQMTPSAPNSNLPALPEDRPLSPRAPSPKIEVAPPVLPPVAAATAGNSDAFSRVPAYPELSPAPTSAQGQVVEVRASTYEGRATPVQYDFAEGPKSPIAAAPSIPVATMAAQPPAPLQPAAGRTLTRPETVYDTEDAYGGI